MTAIRRRLLTQQSSYLIALRAPDRLLKPSLLFDLRGKELAKLLLIWHADAHVALNALKALQLAEDRASVEDYNRSSVKEVGERERERFKAIGINLVTKYPCHRGTEK